jgi:cholesterol oxidase
MVRFEAGGERFLIEDGGEPSMLGWLGEALSPALYGRVAALALARAWERTRRLPKSNLGRNVHRALRSATVSRSTLPLLAMGVDSSTRTLLLRDGRLELGQEEGDPGRTRAYFRAVTDGMRLIAATSGSRYRRNPSQWLSGNVTAHPLGGAPMGRDRLHGVVDSHGEVFGHRGLFVADGSVMPAPIGANPSMTIAALAERFAVRINERIVQRCP